MDTMNLNNFTIKAQEAVNKASEIALGNQQQAIEPAHLLKGMLSVDENVVSYLLKKLNVNIQRLNDSLDEQINAFPKVSGSELYLSGASAQVVQKTQRSEEHTSELQSLMRISYAVFCLKKKIQHSDTTNT